MVVLQLPVISSHELSPPRPSTGSQFQSARLPLLTSQGADSG